MFSTVRAAPSYLTQEQVEPRSTPLLIPIGAREGLVRYKVESIDDLNPADLASMMSNAWKSDYVDSLRPDFTEDYLRHTLSESNWIAVLVTDDSGQPVGFEQALARTLYVRNSPLKSYYATLFSVSPSYRRQGIGRWILDGINQFAFDDRDADVIFSMFHRGAAGSPTVQATYDSIPGWGVNRFHNTPIWGRRIDKSPLPIRPAPNAVARIVWPLDQVEWRTETIKGEITLPPCDVFRQTIRERYDVCFDLEANFRSHYLGSTGSNAGLLWYELGDGATCCVGYTLMPLAVNDRQLRPAGMVQTVHAEKCQVIHYEQILTHIGHYFRNLGCFAMSVYDLGVITHQALSAIGLETDEDRYDYTIRGPREIIDQFSHLEPPYFIDFT